MSYSDLEIRLPSADGGPRPATGVARLLYAAACGVTVCLGLASRRYPERLPAFVARYAGDTLWAAMAFFGISLLWPQQPLGRRAAVALAFCYLIELTQLYHAPWLDAARRSTLGALILGRGFLISDLLCYTAGVGMSAGLVLLVGRRGGNRSAMLWRGFK